MAAISATSFATPILVTSAGHGLSTGNTVQIAGITSAPEANGTWVITVVNANAFSLNGSVGAHSSISEGTWTLYSSTPGPITNATNATPIVITSTTHGLSTNALVLITGIVGNEAANGMWVITKVDNDNFSLNGSVGSGGYLSGGSWIVTTSPGIISGATNAAPIVITSVAHGLLTGDVVVVRGVKGNDGANATNQIIANKITKIDADSFSLDDTTGTGAYTGGGVITKLLLAAAGPDQTYKTTVTLSSGQDDLVLVDDFSRIIENVSLVNYAIAIGNVIYETGIGQYFSKTNQILRFAGQSQKISANIPTGGAQVYFTASGEGGPTYPGPITLPPPAGMLPSDLPRVPAIPIEIGEARALTPELNELILALENELLAASNTQLQRIISREIGIANALRERTALSRANPTGTLDDQILATNLERANFEWLRRNVFLRRNATRVLRTGQGVGGLRLHARNVAVSGAPLLVSEILASIVDAASSQRIVDRGTCINQGMLSVNPNMVSDDQSRLGVSTRLCFVCAPLQGASRNNDNGKITLFCTDGVRSSWQDFNIQPQVPNAVGLLQTGTPMQLDLTVASNFPFRVTGSKIANTARTFAGWPADIFVYVPARTRPSAFQFTQPQMFFMNWWRPNARSIGTGAAQLGHDLRFDTATGVVTLRTEGTEWCTDSDTVLKTNGIYLYVGTIVPIADGVAMCAPGIRLVQNHYNAVDYTDDPSDTNPFWLVNSALHTDGLDNPGELMNPGNFGACWRHYWVEPGTGFTSSVLARMTVGLHAYAVGRVGVSVLRGPDGDRVSTTSGAVAGLIVITTEGNHGFVTDDIVTVDTVRGNTNANGTWRITRLTDTTFSLQGSPPGNAAYDGGGLYWKGRLNDNRYATNVGVSAQNDGVLADTYAILDVPLTRPRNADDAGDFVPGLNKMWSSQFFTTRGLPTSLRAKRWGFFGADSVIRINDNGITVGTPQGLGIDTDIPRTGRKCGIKVAGKC